jgi:hypothetical protein
VQAVRAAAVPVPAQVLLQQLQEQQTLAAAAEPAPDTSNSELAAQVDQALSFFVILAHSVVQAAQSAHPVATLSTHSQRPAHTQLNK